MATNFNIHRVNSLPPAGKNGDIYLLRKPQGRMELYTVAPDGSLVFSKGVTDAQWGRIERLTSAQIGKLEDLDTQEEIDAKIALALAGEKGSISPSDPAPTEDGIWRAAIEGIYPNLGGLEAETGRSVWFAREGGVWSIYADIDATQATGMVAEGSMGAPSGDNVYEFAAPIKDKLDKAVKYTNYFNKENLIENVSVNTTLDPTGLNAEISIVSGSIVAYAEISPNTDYHISGYTGFDVVGRRLGLFQNLVDFSHAPENRVTERGFNSGNNRYLVFIVKHLAAGELADLDIIQVTEGLESPSSYSSFGAVEVKLGRSGEIAPEDDRAVDGKTVFPIADKINQISYVKNLFDKSNNIIEGKIMSVNGPDAAIQNGEGSLGWVKLEKNTDYYISGTTAFDVVGRRGGLFKDIISFDWDSGNRLTSRGFNSGENEYFLFGIQYLEDTPENLDTIQVEEGQGPTEYAEYGKVFLRNIATRSMVVLLTGASFAYEGNPWPDMMFASLGGVGYNKAVSGENITHTAEKMYNGTLYSHEEMEDFEYFLIMQTHNNDIDSMTGIQEDYTAYEPVIANAIPRNQAWDYVLKKYRADCYNLKDDPDSKWFGTPYGKPCSIVVTTDWHDARTVYNTAIRNLRDRHGFNLVELDKEIGFSKNQVHPVTGEQVSLIYAVDTQTIGGITYGWHPIRTTENPVQKRIANVVSSFIEKL